jgi:hypothetical protein
MNLEELTALFGKLGAEDPEGWARSQIRENIPQLARFLFLKQAWKLVIDEDGRDWISERRQIDTDNPGGDIGPAIERILAAGADESDLTRVVRIMQWEILTGLCDLIDDPEYLRDDRGIIEKEAGYILWGLFQVDDNGYPVTEIGGLHESVLETEPTGREMRPK